MEKATANLSKGKHGRQSWADENCGNVNQTIRCAAPHGAKKSSLRLDLFTVYTARLDGSQVDLSRNEQTLFSTVK